MKKSYKLLIASFLSIGMLTACDSGTKQDNFNKVVTSVTLDETFKTLEVGESFQLTPTIETKEGQEEAPYDVTWLSSNAQVAEVNEDGLVTALIPGNTTISFIAGYKIATCSITVPGEEGPINPHTDPDDPDHPVNPDDPVNPDEPVNPEEEDEEMECTVYFFIDYNNIDENDTTGTKLLAKFKWYGDRPLSQSGKVPANPTQSMDPAFPYFIGWSNHTIIDSKDDLWDVNSDIIGNGYYFYLYGIWSDVSQGEFIR